MKDVWVKLRFRRKKDKISVSNYVETSLKSGDVHVNFSVLSDPLCSTRSQYMLNFMLSFIKSFLKEEKGQGISEYGNVLAGSVLAFCFIIGIVWAAQHGFISAINNVICTKLNQMAHNATQHHM